MSDYSLRELAAAAGVSPRTVRYYVALGLLAGPSGAGPGARYGDGHLARLRLVRQLQARHLPLSEIRERLASLTDAEVSGLAAQGQHRVAESAVDYVRSVLGEEAIPERPAPAASGPPFAAPAVTGGAFVPRALAFRAAPVPGEDEELPPAGRAFLSRETPMAAPAPAPSMAPPAEPAAPDRSQWDRISLTPNVELHVRRPLGRLENRRVERLVSLARDVLKEDPE